MALTSVYYDGPVTEVDRAQDMAGAPEYGVYGPGDFKVTAHPTIPYAVLVKAGRAHGHGVTDTAAVDQVVQCATLASGTRWDLITVRRNWQPALGGPSTLEALQSGTTPVIPASRKVGPGVEDDQPIALVRWSGGLSAPAEIIDLRVWAGNGSLVANHDLARAYLTTPGTRVWIAGIDWVRMVGDNDVEAWVADFGGELVAAAFLQPQPNFTFSGTCHVTQVAQNLRRVDVDLAIIRGAGTFGLTGATIPQPLGTVLPVAARGTSNTKAVGAFLNGGGVSAIPIQVNVVPSTGAIDVRSQGAQGWPPNASATVNVTYYI